jgi:hypothetical protein
MVLALAATLAIVVQDHSALRAAPRADSPELALLWQGDVIEIRGERAGYLKAYDYRHERGGYVRSDLVREVGLTEGDAPELLAVLRFLRDSRGSEALGISYGAAYLRAAPARALTAEPFDAIARMAERLADQASGLAAHPAPIAAHLEVVEQLGIHMRSFERSGRMQVCYEGELYRRVLSLPGASSEQRARAVLALTRPECVDPALGPVLRALLDTQRCALLEGIDEQGLTALTKGRLHARRATILAAIAYEQARRQEPAGRAAQRALAELITVRVGELGEDRRAEYLDALVRVGAIRWAAQTPLAQSGPLHLSAAAGAPGQTCVALELAQRPAAHALVRRCTYGIVWLASAQSIAQGSALVVAVQPLESWRELWVFHCVAEGWTVDVLSPGAEEPEAGYVEFAGFVPRTRRLLIVREVKEGGRFHRRFEELRLDDLALIRQSASPELLADFGRWQDVGWRRDTLALH